MEIIIFTIFNIFAAMKKRPTYSNILSNLPDEVLASILSLMPTKSAIRTSILSSRWRNLWKFITNLQINCDHHRGVIDVSGRRIPPSTSIINLLSAIQSSKVIKLSFKRVSSLFSTDRYVVDTLAKFSLDRHVEDFSLAFTSIFFSKLPNNIFQIASLTRLEIANCEILELASLVSLPSLKFLILDKMKISKEAVEKLIIKCPSLENLSLNVLGLDNIYLNHPSVKSVVILSNVLVKFNAPALKFLEFRHQSLGFISGEKTHVFEDISSLVMCKLSLKYTYSLDERLVVAAIWKIILHDLRHVKTLQLCSLCILVSISCELVIA